MKTDLEKQINRICKFLKINLEPKMLDRVFPPDTSFKKDAERETTLSKTDIQFVNTLQFIYQKIPLILFNLRRFIPKCFKSRNQLLFLFTMNYPYIREIEGG